ncbi:uncharacterized protein SAPINGB_P004861 [Magnusiomyces paraingens]|uniref:Uncharacterized protein n=1 Tax=Magnusiomyces paraingens TaxID=2606893 RepID=A0A5E8BZV9_9ASCO|nr:uncharacterized protein SAPINGB_P004861 [Saprochaete ingens]VVT56150.1 unnamed protein product [Saprochaete ingens]
MGNSQDLSYDLPLDLSELTPPVAQILQSANFPQFYSTTIIHQSPADLHASIEALNNSTKHLKQSNQHLKEAIAAADNDNDNDNDPDLSQNERNEYLQYIKDNEHVIAANEYRVDIISRLIKRKAGTI